MPKTLAGAKPELANDLKDLLQKAAYEALLTGNRPSGDNPEISANTTKVMQDAAQRFSDKFAELAYQPMADAIYKFVKEIGITAVPKGTLIAPTSGGPVTGSIIINDFIIS